MADEGVSYFPLYCTLDEKFELIEAEFGLKGFAIVVKLFQRIYKEHGYYCEWNDDISLVFAKQCGIANTGGAGILDRAEQSSQFGKPKNLIDLVVAASVRRGIFNAQLFKQYSILTSKGIQKNFLNIVRNRKVVEVRKEYLLLSDAEIKVNNVRISESYVRNVQSYVSSEQSKVKDSKVKDSKVKDSKVKDRRENNKASPAVYYPQDEKLNQAFGDYINMRKQIRKPMTDRAIELAMSKLKKLAEIPFSDAMDNDLAVEILNQSVMNSWQGLFPLKENRNSGQRENNILDEWRNA